MWKRYTFTVTDTSIEQTSDLHLILRFRRSFDLQFTNTTEQVSHPRGSACNQLALRTANDSHDPAANTSMLWGCLAFLDCVWAADCADMPDIPDRSASIHIARMQCPKRVWMRHPCASSH